MSDPPEEGPEGYRIPARRRVREEEQADDVERDVDDAPLIRLANALLLEAREPEGTLLRIEPESSGGPIMKRQPGASWVISAEPPESIIGGLVRRFKLMAGLPVHVAKRPAMGVIRLIIASAGEVDYCVFVRPCVGGERLLLRRVPNASRRVLFGDPAPDEELSPLRWRAEHAFRLARNEPQRAAIRPLEELHAAALSHGAGAAHIALRSASVLASLLFDLGDFEASVDACAAGRRAAEADRGEGPAAAEFMVNAAAALAKHGRVDDARTLGLEAAAIARRVLVDDPMVAEILVVVGDILRDAGRSDEASPIFRRAIECLTELSGPDDLEVAEIEAKIDG